MVKFIIKRIALMFPLLIVVSFMTFMMTYLTKGDPAVTILHAQGTPNITPQLIAETREKYGFNDPILIQYKNWLIEAIQFKFGSSYITGESVSERIGPAFFNTFKLTLISSISVIITSILLGVISALTKGKLTDRIIRSIAFFLTALPSYWIASMLIIYICKIKCITNFRLNRSRKLYFTCSCRHYYLRRYLFQKCETCNN